ncbi:MAG: nickel transporter [Alphaproteobacteria bacterium]|nr:nickel transporter [Alphaproteobacteria bacterium]
MEVIPVIDLKGGVVVHARMGERTLYRPIETPLARGSDPVDVARGLLALHPFVTLYVADLDAIMGTGDNRAALGRLQRALPELTLWVDSGIADQHAATAWFAHGLGHLVLGSETQRDIALVRRFASEPRMVLSLDFRGDAFQGPLELLGNAQIWPQRVIVMTLHRVGSGDGPDFERLRTIGSAAHDVYAAGGVRDADDLQALADLGVAGALVASSLHNGRLTGADLRRLGARQADPASVR